MFYQKEAVLLQQRFNVTSQHDLRLKLKKQTNTFYAEKGIFSYWSKVDYPRNLLFQEIRPKQCFTLLKGGKWKKPRRC